MNNDFFNKENNMKVAKNTVVSIAYQVRTQDGVLVDEAPANQPLEYLQGHNNLIIGLENALEGKEVGDKFEVRVQPEEGYGEYNENMVQRVPKEVFQGVDEVVVGMRFLADTDIGPVPVVITEVDGDEVVVDGNHMLAGQELHFTVEVVGTREATLEEIAHGHVHGEHDHHHHHDDEGGHGCGCGGHGHHHHAMITIMGTAVAVAVVINTIMITDTVMAAVVAAVTNLNLEIKLETKKVRLKITALFLYLNFHYRMNRLKSSFQSLRLMPQSHRPHRYSRFVRSYRSHQMKFYPLNVP